MEHIAHLNDELAAILRQAGVTAACMAAAQAKVKAITDNTVASEKASALSICCVIDAAFEIGIWTVILRAAWQVLLPGYYMFLARFTLKRPLDNIIAAADITASRNGRLRWRSI
ncbi:MAG: hypothetical protein VW268_10625 [Rhodospirillaceae bacterium]